MREICAQTLYFEEEFPEEPGDWGRDEREVKEPRTPEPGSVILNRSGKGSIGGKKFLYRSIFTVRPDRREH